MAITASTVAVTITADLTFDIMRISPKTPKTGMGEKMLKIRKSAKFAALERPDYAAVRTSGCRMKFFR